MKPDNLKSLIALHAQLSAAVFQLEAMIDTEEAAGENGCPHEHTTDHSTMGEQPGTRIYCDDCKTFLDGAESLDIQG